MTSKNTSWSTNHATDSHQRNEKGVILKYTDKVEWLTEDKGGEGIRAKGKRG